MCENGIILGKEAVVYWQMLGVEVEVSLLIPLNKTQSCVFNEFLAAVRLIPKVIETQTFLGRVDMRLYVVAKDMENYQQIYRDLILRLPHIAEIEALMLISRIKSDEGLPV